MGPSVELLVLEEVVDDPVPEVTVETSGPPEAASETLPPEQMVVEEGVTVTAEGAGIIVTVTMLVLVQLLASVPVTVYVVLTEGEAITVAPVDALKLPAGDHR